MILSSAEAATLIATLDAVEATVRRVAADSLSVQAMIRMDQHSTRRARQRVADLTRESEAQLPPGWAEFLEVDEGIDALLGHLLAPEASVDAVVEGAAIKAPEPLPSEVMAEDPAEAILEQEPEAAFDDTEGPSADFGYDEYGYDDFGGDGDMDFGGDGDMDFGGDGDMDFGGDGDMDFSADEDIDAAVDDAASAASVDAAAAVVASEPEPLQIPPPTVMTDLDDGIDALGGLDTAHLPAAFEEEDDDATAMLDDPPSQHVAAVQLTDTGAEVIGFTEDDSDELSAIPLDEADDDFADGLDELGEGGVRTEAARSQRNARGPSARDVSDDEVASWKDRARAANNLQNAITIWTDIVDARPEDHQALLERGRMWLDLGDHSCAISDFLKADDLTPGSPDVQSALAEVFYARKDYRSAIEHLDDALSIDTDHAKALFLRGRCYSYLRMWQKSLDDLQKAKSLDKSLQVRRHIDMAKQGLR
ncbi:MAG: tetratricopeptide repeat protein [Myxococcota bacterium]